MAFKFNHSNGFLNYNQRNNQFVYESKGSKGIYRVDANSMCNVTTICSGLFYAGWKLPKGKYQQEEDNLADFIFNNEEVMNYYRTNFKLAYEGWKAGDAKNPTAWSPIELHDVLRFGVCKWLNCRLADQFYEALPLKSYLRKLWEDKVCLPTSFTFGNYGHFELVVGLDLPTYSEQDFFDFLSDKKSLNYSQIEVIYDDPFNQLIDFDKGIWNKNQSGNDNRMTLSQFVKYSKPLNQESVMFHLLKKPCC